MRQHRYIIPQKQGFQYFSGEPVPELEPAEFVAEEQAAMAWLEHKAREKGLVLGSGWIRVDAGWEMLEVWQCQADKEAPGRPVPPMGRVLRTGV